MSERTVRTWLAAGTFPEARKRRKKPSSFDPFAPYVLKRWQEGERNGLVLWREIQQQGYTGSERTVYRHIETLKQESVQASLNPTRLHTFTANTAIWLFVRDPEKPGRDRTRRYWRRFARPASPSNEPMSLCKISCRWFRREKDIGSTPG